MSKNEVVVIPPPEIIEVKLKLKQRGLRPVVASLAGHKKLLKQKGESIVYYSTGNQITVGARPFPGIFWRSAKLKPKKGKKFSFWCGWNKLEVLNAEVIKNES